MNIFGLEVLFQLIYVHCSWLFYNTVSNHIGHIVGVGHIGCPSQLAQGKLSTERLGEGPITACIGQAVGVGHIGLPSQLAQGKLSTGRLGIGAHHSLHWAGSGSMGGATGI